MIELISHICHIVSEHRGLLDVSVDHNCVQRIPARFRATVTHVLRQVQSWMEPHVPIDLAVETTIQVPIYVYQEDIWSPLEVDSFGANFP